MLKRKNRIIVEIRHDLRNYQKPSACSCNWHLLVDKTVIDDSCYYHGVDGVRVGTGPPMLVRYAQL